MSNCCFYQRVQSASDPLPQVLPQRAESSASDPLTASGHSGGKTTISPMIESIIACVCTVVLVVVWCSVLMRTRY